MVQGTKPGRSKIRVVRVPEEKREKLRQKKYIYLKNLCPQSFPVGDSVEP